MNGLAPPSPTAEGIADVELILHADNGSPMKGAALEATMEHLGVIASYSRPYVSDDNPYSESLFKTMKYWTAYPKKAIETCASGRLWADRFVGWYPRQDLGVEHPSGRPPQPFQGHPTRGRSNKARCMTIHAATRLTPTAGLWHGLTVARMLGAALIALLAAGELGCGLGRSSVPCSDGPRAGDFCPVVGEMCDAPPTVPLWCNCPEVCLWQTFDGTRWDSGPTGPDVGRDADPDGAGTDGAVVDGGDG